MKLSSILRGKRCKFQPSTMDPELELRFDNGILVCTCSKHVDDLKFGGREHIIKNEIIPALEAVFGKLKYHEAKFTTVGIRHTHLDNGDVVQDQDEYIQALKTITHPSMVGKAGDVAAEPEVVELFWSLLGAAAYMLITQYWACVYVVSLQRQRTAPKLIHIRRLNAIVKVAQRRPAKLIYQSMIADNTLECHSDSGFTKEQESGYGIRGANFLRSGKSRATGQKVYHLVETSCKGHKHVTRDSFSSETRAAVIAADELMTIALTLHELTFGVLSRREAMEMMDNGACRIHTVLTVDSMSLWSAIAAAVVKVPTEKNMAVHLFWLRELLTTGAIKILRWCDTRDMTADCHTKGSIDRSAILELMRGNFEFEHEVKDYEVKAVSYTHLRAHET